MEEGGAEVESCLEVFGNCANSPHFGGIMPATQEVSREFVGHDSGDVVGFACDQQIKPIAGGLLDIHRSIARHDGDIADAGFAMSEEFCESVEGLKSLLKTLDKALDFHGARQPSTDTDALAFVISPRLEVLKLEGVCKNGVVSDLFVCIKGEVGSIESDIVLDECFDALVMRPAEDFATSPKQAVVADQHLCAAIGGLLKGLLAGIHGDGDVSDLLGVFDLESVLGDIPKGFDLKEAIKVFAECVQFDHRKGGSLFGWRILDARGRRLSEGVRCCMIARF